MVQGIKFLTKKSFNPTNLTNQKQVWERQQQEKEAARKAKEREKQLQKERDDALLVQSRGEIAKVTFLYEPPPGMLDKKNSSHQRVTNTFSANEADDLDKKAATCTRGSISNWAERQPGDDDAAAAFRRLLAGVPSSTADPDSSQPVALSSSGGTVLQGTTWDRRSRNDGSSLSALEKAVGKRPQHSLRNALSLDVQIQRFPSLANAPRVAGIGNSQGGDTSVTFKPLGAQIRNVRCLVCGTWGHSKGDRECAISGWDPFAASTFTVIASVEPSSLRNSSQEEAALPRKDVPVDDDARHLKPTKHHKSHLLSHERDRSDRSCSASDESSRDRRRRHKHKKERKCDHKSKRRRYDSSDDSSDSEDRHRRHKSSKKHKRR